MSMESYKVVYVVEPRSVIGGGVRATYNLAGVLGRPPFGARCVVFGVSSRVPFAQRDGESCQSIFSDASRSVGGRYIREMYQVLRDRDVDIVHAMGLYTGLVAIALKKIYRLRFRLVLTVHRVTKEMRAIWLARCLSSYVARNVDVTTFLTEYQRQHYRGFLGYRHERSCIIPNVIPARQPAAHQVVEQRTRLLQDSGAQYLVGYVGRMIESKGVHTFIQTIAELRRKNVNVAGVLVGGGDPLYIEKLRNLARELHLTRHVQFMGFAARPEEYIAACDCILFPTNREALPNLLIESFMLGKPIIVSAIPQLKELVVSNVNGVIVESPDPCAYADEVAKVLAEDSLRTTLSREAQVTYGRQYEPVTVARRYHEVYKACLAEIRDKGVC